MRRFLFVFVIFAFCIGCFAQENLLSAAIKKGANSYGLYRIENTKKKDISLAQMSSYAKDRGYIVVGGNEMELRRFGNKTYILNYLDITDSKNYPAYACFALRDRISASYSEMNGKGSFFYPQTTDRFRSTRISFIRVKVGTIDSLIRRDNVLWSGNIVDGFLDGSGTGLIEDGNGTYTWISGTFEAGLPASNIVTRTVKNARGGIKRNDIQVSSYSATTPLICAQNRHNSDPLLKKAMKNYLRKQYEKNGHLVEHAYQQALKITVSNYQGYPRDSIIPLFIANYESMGSDPQQLLAKANEVFKVYQLYPALDFSIREKYYGVNLWSLLTQNIEWYDKYVEADREVFKEGIEAAKWGKDNSKYGFKNLFASAYKKINEKYDQFNKKVDSDYKEYSRKFDNIKAANAKSKAQQDTWMSQHGHEIDWNKCEEPSGHTYTPYLFSSDYQYSNNGVIVFKNGHRYKYNMLFHSDGTLQYYWIEGPKIAHQRFKTKGEMINYVIDKER